MYMDPIDKARQDIDPAETAEWLEALEAVMEREGPSRAHYLLEALVEKARRSGAYLPYKATTAYLNTIPVQAQEPSPGDADLEWRIRSIIRWNAMAMVVRANHDYEGLGGHIASFASAATLYDVGFNHFFHAPSADHGGDLVMIQGHSSPGIYARAFLEGRLSEEDLLSFRREAGPGGLSSYPHPWLMPGFWQYPTVVHGARTADGDLPGPVHEVPPRPRLARHRAPQGLGLHGRRRDGRAGVPGRHLAGLTGAARQPDLRRQLQPAAGSTARCGANGKIIQELEAVFRGVGWNVIKLVWGSYWDPLLARDRHGLLRRRMEEAVDGEYQAYKASQDGGFVREHFFGKYPELKAMVAHLTDEDIWRLNRGGHDPHKIYAAYAAAVRHTGQPTVILAKTVKGYGMGEAGEGMNITHQQKKMGLRALTGYRDRLDIPVSDEELEETPFYRPPDDSPEIRYLRERREALGGYLPARELSAMSLEVPELSAFDALLRSSRGRGFSTTMAFVRLLTLLTRDPARSATAWCRSSPTRRAPSAWRACSGSSASTPPPASSTNRSTRTRSRPTRRPGTGRSCRRGSTRPGRSVPGWRRAPRRPTTAST